MAALVETVRQARPELVLPDTFGTMLAARVESSRAPRIFAMREAQKLAAPGPPS